MAYFRMMALAGLTARMEGAAVDRCRFRFRLHAGEFDVFFFVDTNPYVLALGAIGHNFYFEIKIDPRTLETPAVFDKEDYYSLCKILGLRRNPENKFTPSAFLQHLNDAIDGVDFYPVTPRDLSPYRRDVEESAKIWYCGWQDNTTTGHHVTLANLTKTRRWLGEKAYLRCKEKNISSRWTDDQSKAKTFTLP